MPLFLSTMSKFLYSTDNLYGERVARRVRAREESRSFIGGSVRHDLTNTLDSAAAKDVRLFIDELLMVLDENSKERCIVEQPAVVILSAYKGIVPS